AIDPLGSGKTYAPRPRVQTERVVEPRSMAMSQIITCGIPFSNRCHNGDATVMSSVKYTPKSVPAKTCCGKFGFTMIESTGMSGRWRVLSSKVTEPQLEAQLTWNMCPGWVGVLALNPPTAAYATGTSTAGTEGSSAMPNTGRRGNTTLPPVTSTQFAWAATPVPRLNPICTLASLVPTIATL